MPIQKVRMDKCEFCHGEIESNVRKCKHCGEWLKKWKLTPQKKFISFLVALAAFYLFAQSVTTYFIKDRLDFFPEKVFFSESSGELTFKFNEQKGKDHLYIVGTITNNSSHNYEAVGVGATYFDENDQILDYEQEFIGTFEAGKSHNFKIDFTSCNSPNDVGHDYSKYKRFEVKIDDGFYEIYKNKK